MRATDLQSIFAKLSPPRLHNALARPRLFEALSALSRDNAVIWLCSPPGAGKSTLAASYIAQAGLPSVWCQLDAGDADPATLFFFLADAVRGDQPALPWLAPELAADMPRFARTFFRDFYARLPQGAVVVFDNVQDFNWSTAGEMLEIAFNEIPAGVTVLALSRELPPARLARMEANKLLATLNWATLRFSRDEALALAQLDERADAHSLAWLERLDGWAAGVVMLREHLSGHPDDPGVPHLEGREAVFRYFAGEIFDRLPAVWQHLLLLLSCLPGLSAEDAQKLTGDAEAVHLLHQLFVRRLFVDRRGGATPSYHFHALFREFLQHEAQRRLPQGERRSLLERAAAILEGQGRIDDAARLYHEAGAHAALIDLLEARAKEMLYAGRGEAWRGWLQAIPAALTESRHWLFYWHGISLCHTDPAAGRNVLELAHRRFSEAGDLRGQLLCGAAIIENLYYEWADFRSLPHWVAQMQLALSALPAGGLDASDATTVYSRLGMAMQFVAPDPERSNGYLGNALVNLDSLQTPGERLATGAMLLHHANWIEDKPMALELIAGFDSLAANEEISPFQRIWWLVQKAFRLVMDAEHDAGAAAIAEATAMANHFGLGQLLFELQHTEISSYTLDGKLELARSRLEQARKTLKPSRRLYAAYALQLEANLHIFSDRPQPALQAISQAVRLGEECGLPPMQGIWFKVYLAYALALNGEFDRALATFDEVIGYPYAGDTRYIATLRSLVQVYALIRSGRAGDAAALLQPLLAAQREKQAQTLLRMFPQAAAEIAALALREEIEIDFIRGVIVRQHLRAPAPFSPHWPWPLAVRVLGPCEITAAGQLDGGATQQKRPMTLLKTLLAIGDSVKSPDAVANHLWPEASNPRAVLNVTVYRLRKLLGNEDAVVLAGGRIRLAADVVWSDSAALVDLCERIATVDKHTPAHDIMALADSLLKLYRGAFCPEADDAWIVAARDRLQNKFQAAVNHLGQQLENLHDWDSGAALYRRAVESDPLAEANYRGLMRCAHALGDLPGAFNVYRRCRDTLSIVLTHLPSAETETLVRKLGLK